MEFGRGGKQAGAGGDFIIFRGFGCLGSYVVYCYSFDKSAERVRAVQNSTDWRGDILGFWLKRKIIGTMHQDIRFIDDGSC